MKIGLALKGGGNRGEVTAVILRALEELLGSPIQNFVHAAAGTSTGGIIAGQLFCPYMFSPKTIERNYRTMVERVFPRKWPLNGAINHVLGVKHDMRDLVTCLSELTGENTLSQSAIPLMFPTVDPDGNQPVHIKSYDPYWSDFKFSHAMAATAAAPTFFRGFTTNYRGEIRRYWDGGLFSNNPSDDLWFDMQKLFPGEEIAIIAIGTGRPSKKISQPWPDGGLLKFGPLVFDAVSTLQDRKVVHKLNERLGPSNFIDLDVDMDRIPPMDDGRNITMAFLESTTKLWVDRNKEKMAQAVEILKKGRK